MKLHGSALVLLLSWPGLAQEAAVDLSSREAARAGAGRAVDWLVANQHQDGSWGSSTCESLFDAGRSDDPKRPSPLRHCLLEASAALMLAIEVPRDDNQHRTVLERRKQQEHCTVHQGIRSARLAAEVAIELDALCPGQLRGPMKSQPLLVDSVPRPTAVDGLLLDPIDAVQDHSVGEVANDTSVGGSLGRHAQPRHFCGSVTQPSPTALQNSPGFR